MHKTCIEKQRCIKVVHNTNAISSQSIAHLNNVWWIEYTQPDLNNTCWFKCSIIHNLNYPDGKYIIFDWTLVANINHKTIGKPKFQIAYQTTE